MKICCVMLLVWACGIAGCDSVRTDAPGARAVQAPPGQAIGDSGVHVSGYVEGGAAVNEH